MLRVERHNSALPPAQRIRTSVEVEKPRDDLLPLLAHGDVVRPGHAHPATPRRRLVRRGGGRGQTGNGAWPRAGVARKGAWPERVGAGPGGPGGTPARRPPQVFISKDLAKHFGYGTAAEALRGLRGRVRPG